MTITVLSLIDNESHEPACGMRLGSDDCQNDFSTLVHGTNTNGTLMTSITTTMNGGIEKETSKPSCYSEIGDIEYSCSSVIDTSTTTNVINVLQFNPSCQSNDCNTLKQITRENNTIQTQSLVPNVTNAQFYSGNSCSDNVTNYIMPENIPTLHIGKGDCVNDVDRFTSGIKRPLVETSDTDKKNYSSKHEHQSQQQQPKISNSYVLSVSFVSFLAFTIVQFTFSITAHSQSMMTDCAAMMIDVVTYLFNYTAERCKSRGDSESRKIHLCLELIPPLISVTTLVAVTVSSMNNAFRTLLACMSSASSVSSSNVGTVDKPDDFTSPTEPNLHIMLIFSTINLVLDIVNVSCFARIYQDQQHQHEQVPSNHTDKACMENNSSYCCSYNSSNSSSAKLITTQHNKMQKTETTALLQTADFTDYVSVTSETDNSSKTFDTKNIVNDVEAVLDDDSEDGIRRRVTNGWNLNMCSAWTHVCADTLRSIAVMAASGFSWFLPSLLTPTAADSGAAIVVSIIILISLVPLIQGLFHIAYQLYCLSNGILENKRTNDDSITNNGCACARPHVSVSNNDNNTTSENV